MLKNLKSPLFVLLASLACSLAFLACQAPTGPETAAPTADTPVAMKGYFIDGPLAGLKYLTSSGKSGTTDVNGGYDYMSGDTVSFSLGNQILGVAVRANKTISPLTLCGTATLDDGSAGATRATNMIRLLLAMDTKANPYGITLPAPAHNAFTTSVNSLLDSASFATDALAAVGAATGATAIIPSASEAKDHWAISQALITGLTTPANADKNMFLTVKIPAGYGGYTLGLSYHAQSMPAGMTSYTSGQSHTVPLSGGIVTFSEKMHSSRWQMTLSLIRDPKATHIGDLLSFFKADGFGKTVPTDYPLDMTSGQRNLEIDLSNNTAAIAIATVHKISGNLKLPKLLPNGTDWTTVAYLPNFTLFNDIKDASSNSVASFSLSLSLPVFSTWITTDPTYYLIPYETFLPDGYAYRTQLYYRTTRPGGYDLFPNRAIPTLTADQVNMDLQSASWYTPSSN